jgi:signal transduction histidine kinase
MSRPLLRSSATRLAVLYVAICAVCVGGLLWIGLLITQRALEREVDLVIDTELEALKDQYDAGGLDRLVDALKRRTDSWTRVGAVYLLVDAMNQPIAGNLSGWPPLAQEDGDWLEFDIVAREHSQDVDHPVRAQRYTLGAYRLLVGTDVSERRRIYESLTDTTLWGIGFTVLVSALIAWWYSRRVAARVGTAATACETVISGELTRRLPVDGSQDEFDQLATAVNHMLDRIEQQTMAVRATFNSAAHDLRAPLHRIRVRLEAATHYGDIDPRAAIGDSVADLERVQRTLATLLQIAQADSGAIPATAEPLDVAALARELVELYAPEARERGLALTCTAADGVAASVRGNRQLLAQLLVNLLENAIKYVPSGGHVEVAVERRYGWVRLQVRDDGPGIPEALRRAALQPFSRFARSDGEGSGLGLSLVAAVVRLHRGRLRLEDNRPGLSVECEFPE